MNETWEPRPLPDTSVDSAAYWEGAADGRLLIGDCDDCGETFFYPRAVCPNCLGSATVTEAAGTGEVYTFSVAHQVANWPEANLPLIPALVELDEGPRLFTNIVDADPDDVEIGTEVEVEFVPTDRDDVAIPVFSPR